MTKRPRFPTWKEAAGRSSCATPGSCQTKSPHKTKVARCPRAWSGLLRLDCSPQPYRSSTGLSAHKTVVYGLLKVLFATEISIGGEDRRVSEQELDLFYLSAGRLFLPNALLVATCWITELTLKPPVGTKCGWSLHGDDHDRCASQHSSGCHSAERETRRRSMQMRVDVLQGRPTV
jgi:hypothetical protein